MNPVVWYNARGGVLLHRDLNRRPRSARPTLTTTGDEAGEQDPAIIERTRHETRHHQDR